MPPETWISSDQALLTSLLLEAEEAVRVCNRCASQLLDGSAPDETVRASEALSAYERAMAVAPTLKALSAKALRVYKASEATDAS